MQTIALNAFMPYLELDERTKVSEQGRKIFEECKQRVQVQDLNYARHQRHAFYNKIMRKLKSEQQQVKI
jgi:hypothetical protein